MLLARQENGVDMAVLTTRETATLRGVAPESRSRVVEAPRPAPSRRRPSMLFVLVAAVLAVTAVSVAERVEQNVLVPLSASDAPVASSSPFVTEPSAPSVAPSAPDAPLTSAVLPSGTMALTLRDGAATITTGVDSPAIELATTTIGDLDLSGRINDAVIAQSDTEVSFDWGGVAEWYRPLSEGIEHGYTIDAPVSDSDDLTVTVAVTDATPTLVGPDNVSISRPGATPLTYRGLVAFDADGTDLPAEMAVVDGTIELRVDTTGAVYPVTIDPIISDAEVIRDPAGVAGDLLGFAVDVDGNRMVASAPNADGGAGAVLVYDRVDADSPWTLSDRLTRPGPEPEPNSRFGDSVAVRGDQIAVGESDRLDAEPEAGLVWVFEFDGEDWASFGDPLQQPDPSAGDRFGADIEWVDDFVLAIGAPGADADRGNVFIARFDSELIDWVYDDVVNVLPPEVAPVAGEEFGYAIGYDDSDVGIGALIVGAPGDDQSVDEQDGGAVYRFFRESLSITWNSKGQFLPGRRVGTAIAVSGNRHLIAGYGAGFFEVNAYEFSSEFPSTWASLDGKIVPGAVPVAADGPVNDYLALDGDVIAVGRGGSGGGVSVYRVGDTWPDGPSTDVEPAGREDGDRIGWSLALENGQLTAGAPGDDGAENDAVNSGAIYSIDLNLAAPATFVNTAEFADWSDPENWSGGVVPGPSDSAIVPSGTSPRIDTDTVVTLGELVVDDGALFVSGQLQVLGETRVNSGSLSVDGGGLLTVEETGLLTIENFGLVSVNTTSELLVRGDIQFDNGDLQIFGRLVIDGDVSIAGAELGSNQVANFGEVLKTGPGPLVVDSDVTWFSDGPALGDDLEIVGPPPDRFVVEEGSVQIDGSSIVTPDSDGTRNAFPGFLRVGAGAAFEVTGDLVLESTTEIEIGIVGPSEPESNFFGRVIVSGNLTKAGLLRSDVVDYSPAPADAYPIITCGDCGPGVFTTLQVAPFDVVTTETGVTLQTTSVPPVTFVGDGSWNDPENWSTGSVPGPTDDVVIPSGSTVVIDAGDSFGVDELTVEGEVRVEGSLTINGNSRIDAALLTVEEGGTLFIDGLLAIEEDSELRVSGGIEFDGGVLSIAPPAIDVAGAGRLTVDGEVSVAGTGQISNLGNVVKAGAGTLGVSSQVTWHSEPSSVLDVQGGSVLLAGGPIEAVDGVAGFPGALRLAAGTTFDVQNDLILEGTSVVESEITGPSNDGANYGRVVVAGSLTKAGLLVSELVGYFPLPSDAYGVFECGNDCSLGDFDTLDVDPFAVVATQTAVTLQLPPSPPTVPTFTGGSGSWTNAANWSTGVVPESTDDVVIPSGSTVVVEAGDIAEVGSLTAEGEVRVVGRLTINEDSIVTGLFDVLSGATLALDATLTVDGPGQLVVREGTGTPGVIEAGEGARFAGTGQVANSGTVRFSSTNVIPIDPDLTWTSGLNSLIEVLSGTVDIESLSFDTQGRFFIAPGAVLRTQNDFALVATSELEFGIDGPATDVANYGRLDLPSGTFTADGTVVLTPTDGFVPAGDVYPLIQCTNGSCLAGDFDVVRGGVVDSRTENAIAFAFVAVNTYTGPATAIAPGDWSDPDGWSSGAVPGISESAAIPAGKVVELPAGAYAVGALSLAGTLTTQSVGTDIVFLLGDGSVIEPTGQLSFGGTFSCTDTSDPGCVSTNTLSIESDVRVDGLLGVTSSVFLDGLTGESLTSTPTVDVSDPLSLTGVGDVILSAPLVKTGTGTFSIGPDLSFDLAADAVLDVREGLVEIQGPGFVPNGTIQVAPGATVSVTGDLALRSTSTLSFGIDGPATSTDNFGQLVLQGGVLTSAGTLRTIDASGVPPTFADIYPLIVCTGGSCISDPVSAFDTLDIDPFTTSASTGAVVVRGPETPISLDFELSLAPGAPASLPVAPNGIAVNEIDRLAVARSSGESTNVAAASVSDIGPEDTSLASIQLGATPLRAIVVESDTLSAIPLVKIDIDGGWGSVIAGSDLENEPLSSLTFGQVLEAGDPTDPGTPSGRLAATPLRAIDVDGTPLRAIPLAAIALGATPLRAIPLRAIGSGDENPWCEVIGGLVDDFADCEAALAELTVTEIALRGVPIESVPLRAIPLRAIDVADSPLRAIALSDIDLSASPIGAIPLRAIPLRAIELEASPLRAIPLRAIPLRAIPVSAIDLEASPLRAIDVRTSPLRAIGTSLTLESTPLRAIDADGSALSAIQVEGAPLRAIPVSAILLADVPLRAIPIEDDWCAVLEGADAGFDCSNGVDPDTTTLSELSVRGVPLRAIPLRAIPLRAILQDSTITAAPLRAIPLRAIPLRAIPLGGISLQSTDLGSIDVSGTPLRAIPLRAIDISGTALSGIPLRAIAPDAIPLRAIPLRAIPLRAIPLRAIPLRAIGPDSTEIGSIPLRAIGPEAIPLRAIPLRAIDVAGSPLRAIPLRAIDASLLNCALVSCQTGTLGDAVSAGAISPDTTFEQLQSATESFSVEDLLVALNDDAAADLVAGLELSEASLQDLTSLDELTLGELPSGIVELDAVTLGVLLEGLPVGTLADLVDAIIDPTTGLPVDGLADQLLAAIDDLDAAVGDPEFLGDLEVIGDITLDALLDGEAPITVDDIEPILRFITVESLLAAVPGAQLDLGDRTLGDLSEEELGQLTLTDIADLVAGEFDDIIDIGDVLTALGLTDIVDDLTLGDLLLALLDPASLAFGGVDFTDVDVSALPASTVGSTTFEASFSITSDGARTVDLDVRVPASAGYVAGSGALAADGGAPSPLEPTTSGDTLTWTFLAEPGVAYALSFDVLPTLTLGSTSLSGTGSVVGTSVSIVDSAAVTVVEGLEPNDFGTIGETTPIVEDVVYLTYVPDGSDVDVFEITVAEDDVLVVELSNLDADLDIVLWGDQATTGGSALANTSNEAPIFPITDPDSDAADAEPLDDFPRLDEVVPTLGVIAVSNQPGTNTETIRTGRLEAGTYYLQVYGANGATTVQPAALQAKILEADQRPECVAIDLPAFTGVDAEAPTAAALANADTLILLNEQRLEQIYGEDARNRVRAAADRLVAAATADPTLGITPVVVPVDAYAAVQQAYVDWDSDAGSCDPNAANAVVAAINETIIDPIRDQLDHITILGTDEIIPMARLADKTTIANEYDYRNEFDGDLAGGDPDGRNAFTSTMWESSILSDEPYGEAAARSLGDRFLYVTDVALGRVVETPDEIVDALDTFVEFDGNLDINTATVLGYDFLADGSAAISDALGDTLPVDDELAAGPDPLTQEGWTADRATEKLRDIRDASARALVSLNAHFDHYRALPAIGDKVLGFDDNLIAQRVRDELGIDSLERSLIFSMGCHSGLSVSDITIARTTSDWAQTLGQQGSLYVGNTGFGYGDTETVAYTEQLMLLFAQQVTNPLERADGTSTTVGQALAWAKNKFVAELQTFSVYDEKAVMESTFYGLPFYRVGGADDQLPPIPPAPTTETQLDATGTPSVQETLDTEITNDVNDVDRGRYYSNIDADGNELVIVAPGRPIQPKVVEDISVVDATGTKLGEVARGAIVLDQVSEYVDNPNPVIATPVFDEALSQQEPVITSGVFPAKPTRITTSTGPGGERQQLVVATGQYDVESGVQRLDDDIDVVVYYAPADGPGASDDFTAPTISNVTSSISGGSLTVSVTAGVPGDDVDRVYLLVAENPGVGATVDWRGLDLARTPGTNRWTGSLALTTGTTNVEFIVQAKDAVGNVGYATNKATNFSQDDAPAPPPPPPPPPAELSVDVPDVPTSGWYTGSVVLTVANAATPATVSVNGEALPGEFEAGDTFTISGGGVQTWEVVTAAGRVLGGTVQIDADGAPRVTLGVPSAGDPASYVSGTRNVDVICRDTTLVDCDLFIDGALVANGDPLPSAPGRYELTFVATDKVGNTTSGSVEFFIEALVAAPTITSFDVPTEPQSLTGSVTVEVAFDDASVPRDTLTVAVDWGDGTAPEVVAADAAAPGTVAATRTYAEVGTYPVTVTVTDAGGLSDSATADVVVVDPDAPPVLESLDVPTGDRVITAPVEVEALFTDRSVPADSFTATIDWGDGTVDTVAAADLQAPTQETAGTIRGSHLYTVPGVYTIVVEVTDSTGRTDDIASPVTVVAPAGNPIIETIDAPTTPQEITNTITVSATFGDTSAPFDQFTATIDWGDGTRSDATVVAPSGPAEPGSVTAEHVYDETGVYPVTVTVTDRDGNSDTELFEFVVVFDPNTSGRVSGSGTYWSGPEAYAESSSFGRPAFFGYNARYRNGDDEPSGLTRLRLLGEFNFRSTSYDYLIVNDSVAIAEGVGRIGSKQYRFRVQGIDNGRLDFFQMTIWDPTAPEGTPPLYDNGVLIDKGDVVLLGGIRVSGG